MLDIIKFNDPSKKMDHLFELLNQDNLSQYLDDNRSIKFVPRFITKLLPRTILNILPKFMIECKFTKAEFNYKYKGNTILHDAVNTGNKELVKCVLEAMPNYYWYNLTMELCKTNIIDYNEYLHNLRMKWHKSKFTDYHDIPYKNIDEISEGGDSPLSIAARDGNAKIVKLLLDKGADVEASTYNPAQYYRAEDSNCRKFIARNKLPLNEAIRYGNTKCVKVLLESKEFNILNKKDYSGLTPLLLVFEKYDTKVEENQIFNLISDLFSEDKDKFSLQNLILKNLVYTNTKYYNESKAMCLMDKLLNIYPEYKDYLTNPLEDNDSLNRIYNNDNPLAERVSSLGHQVYVGPSPFIGLALLISLYNNKVVEGDENFIKAFTKYEKYSANKCNIGQIIKILPTDSFDLFTQCIDQIKIDKVIKRTCKDKAKSLVLGLKEIQKKMADKNKIVSNNEKFLKILSENGSKYTATAAQKLTENKGKAESYLNLTFGEKLDDIISDNKKLCLSDADKHIIQCLYDVLKDDMENSITARFSTENSERYPLYKYILSEKVLILAHYNKLITNSEFIQLFKYGIPLNHNEAFYNSHDLISNYCHNTENRDYIEEVLLECQQDLAKSAYSTYD
ncbi:MAG TPA: ankyrin repeat domain-containing protein [Candidatus Megaira endosymbiont of Nemacystus decipiens]|nr:ankyrin repeat domain-containing protein [Candidatus Megaera endosymbiont of Nemacystus decipiens]